MQLSFEERFTIIDSFSQVFKNGKIYLFGSRVDDKKKGGDIDLYIIPTTKKNIQKKKTEFLNILKEKFNNQKIDVVIATKENRAIDVAAKKGIELNEFKFRLSYYLSICKKHFIRVEKSYNELQKIMPVSKLKFEKLGDDEIKNIDQYLFRFAKFQDCIEQKIFKLIINEYEEDASNITFRDILNRLEKMNILKKANDWHELRDARNNISHEYDDDPQKMSQALNNIYS